MVFSNDSYSLEVQHTCLSGTPQHLEDIENNNNQKIKNNNEKSLK